MSKTKMIIQEAEAVLALRGANEGAWNVLIAYFDRRYDHETEQCVDVDDETKMKRAQGKARAFREISRIEDDAEAILESEREKEEK